MFANKVILITGASDGIGASAAISFAKEGANVVLLARNEINLKKVAEQCDKYGKKALTVKTDVSEDDEVEAAIDRTIDEFGKLDVLVNNAATTRLETILDENAMEAYDKVMNTNLRSVVNLTRLSAPHLIKTKGNIINISSVASVKTPSALSPIFYNLSKAALHSLTRSVAFQLAPHGVRVNAVSPGPTATNFLTNSGIDISGYVTGLDISDISPLQRISAPEEIADLILFLASDKAKGITGSDYVTDNGYLLS